MPTFTDAVPSRAVSFFFLSVLSYYFGSILTSLVSLSMSWVEDPGWEVHRGLNLSDLNADEAYVNVTSLLYSPIWLYTLSDACYKCPYSRQGVIPPHQDQVMKISTKYGTSWRLLVDGTKEIIPRQDRHSLLCELEPDFGEFGVYDLVINATDSGDVHCSVTTAQESVNVYLPLVLVLIILGAFWVGCCLLSVGFSKWTRYRKRVIQPTSGSPTSDDKAATQAAPARKRLKSLDTFRGISIVLMIFVNDGAGGYWFLEHATWNGLHVADLLFPWFMWIMGVCIPISIKSQLKKKVPRITMFIAVVRRACILFMLGLILNTSGGTKLETIRIFGVLQRFGIVYFIVATLSICFTCRNYSISKVPFIAATQDILVLLPQWLLMAGIVAGHCALTFYLEVPGCPNGYLGPGGLHDNARYRHCIGGATGYVDRLILGETHVYQEPTADEVFESGPFDPEGVMGCLLSVFQVFLGVQAGTTLSFFEGWKERATRWVAWGTGSGILAGILCLASREDGWIPVNKNMWSLSFVMVTTCFAFYLLTACYFLIDVKGWWSGAPFFYPGMNATIMYVGHEMCYGNFPWHWSLGPMNTHFLKLIESIWGTGLWVLVAFWLHHNKFFLSI